MLELEWADPVQPIKSQCIGGESALAIQFLGQLSPYVTPEWNHAVRVGTIKTLFGCPYQVANLTDIHHGE